MLETMDARCGLVTCFVLRVVGTHQYLSFFSEERLLVFACMCTPVWWSDNLAIYALSAVFSPACGAGIKVWQSKVHGTPHKFEAV